MRDCIDFFIYIYRWKIKFTVCIGFNCCPRSDTALFRAIASLYILERTSAWENRERAATRSGSFCFSTAGSRDAFGSRFDHIKRQMSFYGGHCHPGTACRESPVSYARTFLVPDESSLRYGRLIKILNDLPLGRNRIIFATFFFFVFSEFRTLKMRNSLRNYNVDISTFFLSLMLLQHYKARAMNAPFNSFYILYNIKIIYKNNI